ncbi:MAG: formyltransferase family protein [Cyclobacteriaceae bacterium]
MKKFTLFLLSEKGFCVLKSIIEKDAIEYIQLVIIGKDDSVENDFSSQIQELCEKNGVENRYREEKTTIESDYSIAVSWRWLIDSGESNLIVIHDSLLPKYRGFSPLVNQLINGEKKIGVTAILANNEYDRGPIIRQEAININYPIKIQAAIELIVGLYQKIVISIISDVESGSIKSIVQDESEATYSIWRDEKDYLIDWNLPSDVLKRFVDSVGSPYKGAKTFLNGEAIKIDNVEVYDNLSMEICHTGKVLLLDKERPVVICGSGLIKITEASFEDTCLSIFPLVKFRSRFGL